MGTLPYCRCRSASRAQGALWKIFEIEVPARGFEVFERAVFDARRIPGPVGYFDVADFPRAETLLFF